MATRQGAAKPEWEANSDKVLIPLIYIEIRSLTAEIGNCKEAKYLVYQGLAIVLSHILKVGVRSAFAVHEVLILYGYQQLIVA